MTYFKLSDVADKLVPRVACYYPYNDNSNYGINALVMRFLGMACWFSYGMLIAFEMADEDFITFVRREDLPSVTTRKHSSYLMNRYPSIKQVSVEEFIARFNNGLKRNKFPDEFWGKFPLLRVDPQIKYKDCINPHVLVSTNKTDDPGCVDKVKELEDQKKARRKKDQQVRTRLLREQRKKETLERKAAEKERIRLLEAMAPEKHEVNLLPDFI